VVDISQFDNTWTSYTYIKGALYSKYDRERRRKERGNYHYEQMLKRYDVECGECVTVSPAKEVSKFDLYG